MVGGQGGFAVADLAGGGQVTAVGSRGGNGAGVHQRHRADLPLAGLGAFAVGEVAGRVPDGQLAVGGGVARAEAGTAEALAEDAARRYNIRHRAVFDQLQIGRHTVGVDAQLKGSVAAAAPLDKIRHGADVFKRAAAAARHNALIHIDAPIGADFAQQIHLHLAAQLAVCLLLDLVQDILGVRLYIADGVGVAGVHRQGDHTFHR